MTGDVFNIATGERITLNDVVSNLRDLTSYTGKVDHCATRAGDIAHSQADITHAREAFGFQPRVAFKEGLRRMVLWYREAAIPLVGM